MQLCATVVLWRFAAGCVLEIFSSLHETAPVPSAHHLETLSALTHRTQSRCCQSSDPQLTCSPCYTVSLWGAAKIVLEKTVQTRLIGSPSKAAVWPFSLKIIEKGRKM